MRCYNATMTGESVALILVGILTFAVGGLVVVGAKRIGAPGLDIISLFGWGMLALGATCIVYGVRPPPNSR
ncbi:MAG TPA: hypothetical protein VKB78_08830 [Pirellulales bacterium]|nr:hypothetical protein [Pirellulales bacterium]